MDRRMHKYELDAYLGEAASEVTDEQKALMLDVSDGQAEDEAFSTAVQVILGDDTLDAVAQEWRRARAAERDAMERLKGAIAASAAQGVPETVIAATAGVARQTVRKALGK